MMEKIIANKENEPIKGMINSRWLQLAIPKVCTKFQNPKLSL